MKSAFAVCASLALFGCIPDAPSQFVDTDCDQPPASAPSELTSDPNVDIVIADHTHPQVLDASEVVFWDGWLAHKAEAKTFFCHRSERTVLALEAAPGPHKLLVVIRFFGRPGGDYDQLNFELKFEHEVDVPDDGVVVSTLELLLGEPHVFQAGRELASPQARYHESRLASSRRP
jgi:hypothetical protein